MCIRVRIVPINTAIYFQSNLISYNVELTEIYTINADVQIILILTINIRNNLVQIAKKYFFLTQLVEETN